VRENFRSLHQRRHIDFPELPAHLRALSSPRWHSLWRVAWLFIDFPMHASCRVIAHRRAGGVSAGCYFKSCQSSVIAPVFQRPEQDIVESSTEEVKHARVVSLPGERCTVKRENDELQTCMSCIAYYTPWFDELARIFLAWYFYATRSTSLSPPLHLAIAPFSIVYTCISISTLWYSYLYTVICDTYTYNYIFEIWNCDNFLISYVGVLRYILTVYMMGMKQRIG